MKKLLAIVLVLGLAGLANAAWLEDYESYTPPEPVADQGAWLAGGTGAGDWWLTGSATHAGLGINGSISAGSGGVEGNHINMSFDSGTTTINYLVKSEAGDRGAFVFGQEAYGAGSWYANGFSIDYQAGWNVATIDNDAWTQIGGTANPDTWGWHEIEMSVNMDDRSAYVKIRDVDDTTGAPTTAWGTPVVVAAGGIPNKTIQYFSTGHKSGMLIDGLPEPMTLSVLALGGLAALLRRRR